MEQLSQFTLQGHEWQKLRVFKMADPQHLLSLASLSPVSDAAGTFKRSERLPTVS